MSFSLLQLVGIALGVAVVSYIAGVVSGVFLVTGASSLQANEELAKEGYE